MTSGILSDWLSGTNLGPVAGGRHGKWTGSIKNRLSETKVKAFNTSRAGSQILFILLSICIISCASIHHASARARSQLLHHNR